MWGRFVGAFGRNFGAGDIDIGVSTRPRIGPVGQPADLCTPRAAAGFAPPGGPSDHVVISQVDGVVHDSPDTPIITSVPPEAAGRAAWVGRLGDRDAWMAFGPTISSGVSVPRARGLGPAPTLAEAAAANGAPGGPVSAANPWTRSAPGKTTAEAAIADDATGDAAAGHRGPDSAAEVFDHARRAGRSALAQRIVVFGARGGLGKTSLAQALAATAAARELPAVLVDGNREQGDQHLLLRLDHQRPHPSAYETARTGRPQDAICPPRLLDDLRGGRRDQIRFALVAAPPSTIPGAAHATTPAVYRKIIDHAARISDLVIIDTHPLSPACPGPMLTDLILPILRGGAWGVGLTDASIPGLTHLEETLDYLIESGVPQDRLLTIINRVPASAELDMETLGGRLARRSRWVGPIYADDEEIPNRSNAGYTLDDVHVMAHQVENILYQTCGLDVRTAPPGTGRRNILGFLNRKQAG